MNLNNFSQFFSFFKFSLCVQPATKQLILQRASVITKSLLQTPKGMSHGERKHVFSARCKENKNNIKLN